MRTEFITPTELAIITSLLKAPNQTARDIAASAHLVGDLTPVLDGMGGIVEQSSHQPTTYRLTIEAREYWAMEVYRQ